MEHPLGPRFTSSRESHSMLLLVCSILPAVVRPEFRTIHQRGSLIRSGFQAADPQCSCRIPMEESLSDSCHPFGRVDGTPSYSETYKFTRKPVSQTTGLLDVKRGMEGSGFH